MGQGPTQPRVWKAMGRARWSRGLTQPRMWKGYGGLPLHRSNGMASVVIALDSHAML